MLTAAERLAMRCVAFDLETTGVNPHEDVPVSYGFVEPAAGVRAGGLVNPGRPIPAGASAVHGIVDGDVVDATPLAEAATFLVERISDVWGDGGAVVGMNVGYDLTMVDSVCRRLGIASFADRGGIGPVFDVLILDRQFDKYRKGSRRLGDLCAHYGITLDAAHAAVDDAEASLFVFDQLVDRYERDILAIPRDRITATLRTWHRTRLRDFSDYLERNGKAPIPEGEYEWPIATPTGAGS